MNSMKNMAVSRLIFGTVAYVNGGDQGKEYSVHCFADGGKWDAGNYLPGMLIAICAAAGGCMTVCGGCSVPAATAYIIAGGSGETGKGAMAVVGPAGGKRRGWNVLRAGIFYHAGTF